MKKEFLLSIILALMIVAALDKILFAHSDRAQGRIAMKTTLPKVKSATVDRLRIAVVYDNNPYKAGFTTAWGFACVIKGTEKTILFDTGGNSAVLLNNMQQLGIDPEEIDIVVLSHIHGDHVGGLNGFLKENFNVTVYECGGWQADPTAITSTAALVLAATCLSSNAKPVNIFRPRYKGKQHLAKC